MRAVRLLTILVCVLPTACSTSSGPGASPGSTLPVFVTVENHSFADVRVSVLIGDAGRIALGRVGSLSTVSLRIPPGAIGNGSLRLLAIPLAAGERHVTSPIRGIRGTTIVWQLGNEPAVSRWFIR